MPDFGSFKASIIECLAQTHGKHRPKLTRLLTLRFQMFENERAPIFRMRRSFILHDGRERSLQIQVLPAPRRISAAWRGSAWQARRREWICGASSLPTATAGIFLTSTRKSSNLRCWTGKPVPPKVLADYPAIVERFDSPGVPKQPRSLRIADLVVAQTTNAAASANARSEEEPFARFLREPDAVACSGRGRVSRQTGFLGSGNINTFAKI